MDFNDPVDDSFIFCLLCAEYSVIQVLTDDRFIGGDLHNVHAIDVAELFFLGHGCTGHACQLLIHSEVVLEGDGSQSL